MRVALVTSATFPEPHWRDVDSPEVARRLRGLGVETDVVAWDADPAPDWRPYDAVLLQSPWSMWAKLPAFHAWLRARVDEAVPLLNPATTVALGCDKRYLLGLAAAGVPIVPTSLIEDAHRQPTSALRAALSSVFASEPSPRRTVVVKPVAAGGALGTREFAFAELDELVGHVRAMNEAGTAAIVQPYIRAIDEHRELAVVMADGAVSHAITKAAILRPGTAERAFHPDPRHYGPLSADEDRVVRQAYRALVDLLPDGAAPPFSVRLDFIIDPDAPAGLWLLEVEMVAPVRFFSLFPAACDRFAESIVARRHRPAAP